jgi:(p)ppGpp synthase/HD superfamily hydrolase
MSQSTSTPKPILGDRFVEALAYAVELHGGQARKATVIPYLSHLLAVCSLVLEDGGTEDEAIAALLHDGPEDQGGQKVLDEIDKRFGDGVASMVDGLSDTLDEAKPPWRPRKEAYLARLRDEHAAVLRVSLGDKVHNLSSISTDHLQIGDELWGRFNAGREDQGWYYRSLLGVYEQRLPDSRNLPEFRRLVSEVF